MLILSQSTEGLTFDIASPALPFQESGGKLRKVLEEHTLFLGTNAPLSDMFTFCSCQRRLREVTFPGLRARPHTAKLWN